MQNKSKTEGEKPVVKEEKAAPVKESVYTAEDLAENYKVFGVRKEIVVVALAQAGVKSATFPEAKRIVENFKNKEVK